MLITTNRLIRKGYAGFALYPFIFLRKEYLSNERILRHERIHLAQQKELLLIGFLLLYFGEYVYRRTQSKSWREAYLNISFEREAYANDGDSEYLHTRKRMAWRRYLFAAK